MKYMFSQLMALMNQSRQSNNRRLLIRFVIILTGMFAVYSVLFHVIMEMEGQRHSWLTGLYWTLTVMSTLGFGDITFTTDLGRLFSMLVMLSGVIFLLIMLPFTFIQFFYAPWLEAQNRARAPRKVPDTMSGHVILTHFDAVAQNLVEKLDRYGIPYVILAPDLQQALHLHERGLNVVLGEVDAPETYTLLRVQHAALVVVMNGDIASTNIIFTIHEAYDQVPTITNADDDDSLDILRLAGSTHTFQFTKMLGQVLARRVLGLSLQANIIGQFDELRIAEAPAMRSPLQGQTLAQSRLRELTGVNVVGLWEQGRFHLPSPATVIGPSTVLVLAGSQEQLRAYDKFVGSSETDRSEQKPVLVLGGGRVGMSVAQTLGGRGIDYRVVEKKARTTDDERIIQGSAADLDVLIRAGINDTPSIIVTTHDDDLNIFLTIYCRRLRPDVQIICRASLDRNINTMHRAGANLVMSFSSLVTTTILNLLKPEKLLMISEGLHIFRSTPHQSIAGKALHDLHVRENTGQNVHNIVVVEEDSEVHIITGCATSHGVVSALHLGISEFYIKKGGRLTFTMIHNWGEEVVVRPRTVGIVEENGVLQNNYVLLKKVKSVQSYPTIYLNGPGAVARFNSVIVTPPGSHVDTGNRIILNAPDTRGEIISRTITTGGGIVARGEIVGNAVPARGHLECKGLILGGGSIHAIPELQGTRPGVELSHEAAVGKIAQEEIEYLMARGLDEDEATSTIVRGFLNVEIMGLPAELQESIDRTIAELNSGEAM